MKREKLKFEIVFSGKLGRVVKFKTNNHTELMVPMKDFLERVAIEGDSPVIHWKSSLIQYKCLPSFESGCLRLQP